MEKEKKFHRNVSFVKWTDKNTKKLSISDECARNHRLFEIETNFMKDLKELGFHTSFGSETETIYEHELKEI